MVALRIYRPAWKKPNGKIVVAPKEGLRPIEFESEPGQRGFVTSAGDFVDRQKGADIAIAAGQVPETVSRLHSEDLPEYKKLHRKQ